MYLRMSTGNNDMCFWVTLDNMSVFINENCWIAWHMSTVGRMDLRMSKVLCFALRNITHTAWHHSTLLCQRDRRTCLINNCWMGPAWFGGAWHVGPPASLKTPTKPMDFHWKWNCSSHDCYLLLNSNTWNHRFVNEFIVYCFFFTCE